MGQVRVTIDSVRRTVVGDRIERASPNDMMEVVAGSGSSPAQVGAVLVLQDGEIDLEELRAVIASRIRRVPRLRQRLVSVPFGCGRPIWIDDVHFRVVDHVHQTMCPAPGDEAALLAVAIHEVTARLPVSRPLWSATLVKGLADGRDALVVVFHHVLADGIGGLAVLAQLVDGLGEEVDVGFPRPAPTTTQLVADALASRARSLFALPARVRVLAEAAGELRLGAPIRAERCSLNRPTGPRRSMCVARGDLQALRDVAHAHAATVNDVVLTAVAGALTETLRRRGEHVERFVVSMPISGRTRATATTLGNQTGAVPVVVPALADPIDRLHAVAASTAAAKAGVPGASAALLGPFFRALSGLHLLRWFIDHQSMVTTVVTDLHGPDTPASLLGTRITEIIPMSMVTGNLTVGFAGISYCGTIALAVMADPDACPDLPRLCADLERELDELALA